MSTGNSVHAQINRGPNQPVARGATMMAPAKRRPIPRKKVRLARGLNQRKWRLIKMRRWLGSMAPHTTLVPTSKSPAASPHHADKRSRSRALMGCHRQSPIRTRNVVEYHSYHRAELQPCQAAQPCRGIRAQGDSSPIGSIMLQP